MAKSFNQKAKILVLQQMLIGTSKDQVITMQEILDEFQKYGIRAERKSVYDDITTLRDFGYPIKLLRGRNGGYYLEGESTVKTGSLKKAEIKTETKTEVRIKKETVIKNVWQVSKEEIQNSDNKNVRLLCSNAKEQAVRDYFGDLGEYKEKEEGWFTVTLPPVYGPQFFGWLTAMGTDVKIQKPKKTAQAYRDYLKTLAKEYKGL